MAEPMVLIAFRINADHYEILKELAANDNRRPADFVKTLLLKELKQRVTVL